MSVISNLAGGALQNLTGNLDTAVLVVDDYRTYCNEVEANTFRVTSNLLASIEEATASMNAIRQAANQALSAGASPEDVATFKEPKYFKVQFNPSELQINGALEPEEKQDAQSSDQSKRVLIDSVLKPAITLSVNLYFDEMNKADAFRSTYLNPNLNVADVATNLASVITSLKGDVRSVQPQVEAILGAICNSYTRYITFCWTDFYFTGQLTHVNAQYTMFSTSGIPIRAVLSLRIQQELDPANLTGWYKNLDSAFGGSGVGSILNSVGNLLNTKL